MPGMSFPFLTASSTDEIISLGFLALVASIMVVAALGIIWGVIAMGTEVAEEPGGVAPVVVGMVGCVAVAALPDVAVLGAAEPDAAVGFGCVGGAVWAISGATFTGEFMLAVFFLFSAMPRETATPPMANAVSAIKILLVGLNFFVV